MFIIIEEPVPYVDFAIPGEKQFWPNNAPCESPIKPEIGIGFSKTTDGFV
jgi:hypothetical protein